MASTAPVEHRLTELQQALIDLARQNDRTARSVDRLSVEMREFKDEMRVFKDEVGVFKNEVGVFKNEVGVFKDEVGVFKDEVAVFKNEVAVFKDDVGVFKDEMRVFKDEMRVFKDDVGVFKDETRKGNADLRSSLNRQNAELSETLGRLAEDIVGPSIPTLFKRFFPGDEPEFVMRARKRHKDSNERREFDTPAWNDKVFLVTETKARLRPEDLDSLTKTIDDVRNYFPESDGKKVFAALASLYIDPTLVTAGERRGFIMIALGNNLAEVMNSEGFKPAEF